MANMNITVVHIETTDNLIPAGFPITAIHCNSLRIGVEISKRKPVNGLDLRLIVAMLYLLDVHVTVLFKVQPR